MSQDNRPVILSAQQLHTALDSQHGQHKQVIIERKNGVIDKVYALYASVQKMHEQSQKRITELEGDNAMMKAELDYWRTKDGG